MEYTEGKLCKVGFGFASAVVCALAVLLFGLLAYIGYQKEAADYMVMHPVIAVTPAAILIATLVAAIKGFIFGYIFAWIYNCCPFHNKKIG